MTAPVPRRKLEMPAEKIRVQMRLDHTLDRESASRSLLEVHADVPAGIHHNRPTGCLVADDI